MNGTNADPPPEQLALVRETVRTRRPKPSPSIATDRPIARVAVDMPLAHLDRPFDYLVTEAQAESAQPGCRVRVRFAGQRLDAFVLDRVDTTDHDGRLGRLERVVSPEVVLRADIARLCRAVADRYAGTFADVVRLAVPPRHAREEKTEREPPEPHPLPDPDGTLWEPYAGSTRLLDPLAEGGSPRVCWTVLPGAAPPGADWPAALAQTVLAALRSGRGSVVCLPDVRDVDRLDAALTAVLGGPDRHAVLTAAQGPQARYRAFLALARGHVKVAIGNRAAAFAPVHELGLAAVWDDGDDLHAEPRAPYPHAREVLLTRAHEADAAVLLAGPARSVEAHALVESAWCIDLAAEPERRRHAGPRVTAAGADSHGAERDPAGRGARLPREALTVLRESAPAGPVLVSVPRSGYRPTLSCQTCHAPARCATCHGPLGQPESEAAPACRWCGTAAPEWVCPECDGTTLRAPVIGERRTAEEIGRAVSGVTVRTSAGERVLDRVDGRPQVVVATPGAEPVADGGYAAGLILDAGLVLARADLRTAEEAVRRWSHVVSLVRPESDGGRVVLVGSASAPPVQALVRADPVGFAARELAERRSARLPPTVRLATVSGPSDAVTALLDESWPEPKELLGPVATGDDEVRLVIRVPRREGSALAAALQRVQSQRSAHKAPPLRVRVDPYELE
ncbi:MAG TPA: primosomal protein N' [Nocardioidaceae bacterium]|nr:primosomal protein N' [Nocardioidaceae bacterium]